MANFQHLKASRTRVLDRFPTKEFGNDGDIVISRISGRGVFICSKAGGMWYVANQMQELSRIGKATLKNVTTNKLTVKNITNTEKSTDRYIVSDSGNIQYKTGKQVANDLPLPINNIIYKQAYCSLERYTDQETCEANGGTWYYSINDTHDSISSTAENQLLTIGQMHNSVDTEPTLLYDGSVLEIKRNTDFDDNWQTATNDNVLKLSYSSSVSSTLGTDSSGVLKVTASSTDLSGTLEISTIAEIGSDTDKFLMSDSGVIKFVTGANLRSYIGAGTGDGDITGVSITTDTGAGSKAEDTGGSADFSILGSSGVGVTNSGTTITAVAVPAEIDHDSLNNFVANEHVDHTSITLTAGDGLTGGGDISDNRSFAVNVDDSTIEINSDSLRVKDDGITYAKLQNVTNARMLGNNAGSDGVVTEMTKANVLSFLNVADGAEANVSGDSGNAAIYDNSGTPAFKSGITKAEVLSLLNVEDGATAGGASALNDLSDVTYSSGDLTISSLDKIITSGDLTFEIGGDAQANLSGGDWRWFYQAAGGPYEMVSIGYEASVGCYLKMAHILDPDDDFFKISHSASDRQTTISTDSDDAGGNTSHLNFDIKGNIDFDPASGFVGFSKDDTQFIQLDMNTADTAKFQTSTDYNLTFESQGNGNITFDSGAEVFLEPANGGIKIKEDSDKVSETAGYGQLWVKSDSPNNLYFTDDTGQDVPITNNGAIANQKFFITSSFFHGNTNAEFIPIGGGSTFEQSSIGDTTIDDTNFIVPYDLKINTIYANIVKLSSLTVNPGNTSFKLYKAGSAYSGAVTVNLSSVGFDTTNLHQVFTWDFSSENNAFSAGQVMQIQIDPTNTLQMANITIVGEYT